ncbi:hypothetical protein Ancab_009139 [Ancistrocladus abbreviatus]
MQLPATYAKEDSTICVSVPPTRSDVLHPCDVMEDVGIAFGYNEIRKRKPMSLKPLPLNERSDLIISEVIDFVSVEARKFLQGKCGSDQNYELEINLEMFQLS